MVHETSSAEQVEVDSAPHLENIVEVDREPSDTDSSLGDEYGSSTASLSSSIFNYTYENGRRYHNFRSGEYVMPNDESEQDRLDLKHHVFKLVLGGKLFLAPAAPNPQRILDVGTGTGIWAIDVADEYTSAHVLGIDLSPIQPRWIPSNLTFLIDDAEDVWPYKSTEKFDLVHWRVLSGSIKEWPRLYSQAYTHTKPGGWVESQEHDVRMSSDDDTVDQAPELVKFWKTVDAASEKFGKKMDVADSQKQWMIDAGFVEVEEVIHKVPLGRWPKDPKLKEIGSYFQAQTIDAVEPVSMALLTRVLGMSPEEARIAMIGPRKELKDPKLHLYMRFHFVYGRKPLPSEV